MKKLYISIIITSIFVLLILFTIFINVNYDKDEFKLGLKSLLGQELTLDEMKSSNLYKAFLELNYNSNIDEVNSIMKKENSNSVAGIYENWEMVYGNALILFRDNKSHVSNKLVSFKTPYTIELNYEELNSLFKCRYIEEIIEILGEPLILGESYNENGKVKECTYEWGIKTKYFETQQNNLLPYKTNNSLPYKRKFRARVTFGENNLIWTVNIDKY